jgi:putative membrane protein
VAAVKPTRVRGRVKLTPARGLLGVLALAQVAYGRASAPRPPAQTRGVVVLMLAASTAEALEARGARGVLAGAVAGAVGFGAEVVGVATGRPFGRYAYTDRLGSRVRGVPLLAAAAWALLARPAWIVAGRLSERPVVRVPLAAGALTAWDVFLDPRMAREGYWTWPGGGAYEGIPASNFAGWLATALAAFALVAVFDRKAPDARDDGALALYAWTWAGETVANAALWRRPIVAAAGTAAMGAFAVPALVARYR